MERRIDWLKVALGLFIALFGVFGALIALAMAGVNVLVLVFVAVMAVGVLYFLDGLWGLK